MSFILRVWELPHLIFDGGTPRFGYYGGTEAWEPNATTLNLDLGSTLGRWNTLYLVNQPNVSSDKRLKKNITKIDYGLETIIKLKPVRYKWKNETLGDRAQLGFLAQDLQSVIPEIVSKAKINPDDLEDRGLSKSEIQETYGVYYNEIIPVLVKAIQEQQEQIELLQAEVSKLKKQ